MAKIQQKLKLIGLALAAACLVLCLSACGPKMVTVQINDTLAGETSVEVEEGKTVADALEAANLELGADDLVSPELDAEVSADTPIVVTRAMNVTIMDGEDSYVAVVTGGTVGDAIVSADIVLKEGDTTDIDTNTEVSEGMVVTITRAPEPEPVVAVTETTYNVPAAPTGVYEISRTPVPNCDDGSHGYYEIQMSDGSMRYEEY